MKFRVPAQKRPVFLVFFLYSILTFLFCLFCLGTASSLMRARSVDRLFHSLLSGTTLSAEESSLLDSLSPHDIQFVMSPWSEPRQKAAFLILDYNGFSGFKEPELSGEPDKGKPYDGGTVSQRVSELLESCSYREAENLLLDIFKTGNPSSVDGGEDNFFLLLRNTVMKTETYRDWIERLGAEEEDSDFGRAFFLATCYEKLNDGDKALLWYGKARENSSNWKSLRRSQWYTLRLMTREYPELLGGFLDSSGTLRNDGAYFDDVMDEIFSVLIRQRRWSEFAALIPHIQKAGLTEAASQGLFLLEKGREEGYVTFNEPLMDDPAFSPDPKGYYALRSRPATWPLVDSSIIDRAAPEADSMDDVYQLLLNAGYKEEAYRLWDINRENLSLETVKTFCRYLESTGDLYELICFVGFWYYSYPADWALELLPWVYPGAGRYSLSDGEVPQELILGIIRRESAFHESIFSFAGAGGLMQLMPSTAEDLARKNRLENWNLLKADDNILLGTLYLQWLKERPWTTSYVDVLAAYNGGGGNLRGWKRRMGYDDPDLFIQSIPFKETRDYVRKVIVAAASYRYLDTGTPPGEWLEQFYRSF